MKWSTTELKYWLAMSFSKETLNNFNSFEIVSLRRTSFTPFSISLYIQQTHFHSLPADQSIKCWTNWIDVSFIHITEINLKAFNWIRKTTVGHITTQFRIIYKILRKSGILGSSEIPIITTDNHSNSRRRSI